YIQSTSDEEALYKAFSVSELNLLIDLYNDYVKNPEDYAKPKTKKEIDIERQEKAIEKHMKDMKMDYKSENRE
ncbi:hypothetical protein ACG3NR_30680, partial [Pseudomonas aeruginosa]